MSKIFYGIEAGGTKFICAIASLNKDDTFTILEKYKIDTSEPKETLEKCLEFFQSRKDDYEKPSAMGIGSFGPVCLDKNNLKYGFITSTPKPNWSDIDILGFFERALSIRVAFDTDVNAAALGEGKFGAALGLSDYIYITIGTGIGGGVISNSMPVHGLIHPELGHIIVQKEDGDNFLGNCPYHKACLEGLCSGPALQKRAGKPAIEIDDKDITWDYFCSYMAKGLANIVLILSPQKIILGGGVMNKNSNLILKIKEKLKDILNDYVDSDAIKNIDSNYLVLPKLKDESGILGSLELARSNILV